MDPRAEESGKAAVEIQRRYWTASPAERSALAGRGVDALAWKERLRLLHLACLDALAAAQALPAAEPLLPIDLPPGPDRDLIAALAAALRSPASPFRPRPAAIWHDRAERTPREPDLTGLLANASLTHGGCLEILRVDAERRPAAIDFVALDDLRGAIFGPPSLFRMARLSYEGDRPDEIVGVPLLYGLSWSSELDIDRDGSMTRFIASLASAGDRAPLQIGVGQQDLLCWTGEGSSLFGLGSIGEIATALDLSDPRFDEKCRGRGLDPERVRRRA